MMVRRNMLKLAGVAAMGLGLSGCYAGDVNSARYAGGYGDDCSSRYGDSYYEYDPYAYDDGYGYDCYDSSDYYGGFVNIGFGGGWYDNYYYPGYGTWLFDPYGYRYPLNGHYLNYWGGRRAWWRHHGQNGGGWGNGGHNGGGYSDGVRPNRPATGNRPVRPTEYGRDVRPRRDGTRPDRPTAGTPYATPDGVRPVRGRPDGGRPDGVSGTRPPSFEGQRPGGMTRGPLPTPRGDARPAGARPDGARPTGGRPPMVRDSAPRQMQPPAPRQVQAPAPRAAPSAPAPRGPAIRTSPRPSRPN